ncbi:MAG: hypothetical protein KKD35_02290 [Elusimicrobia bacterium]|nr:hypothetical protein [Elusimicrobiota bacterium]
MDNPSENLKLASTLIHMAQGVAFFIIGMMAIYVMEKGEMASEKFKFIAPLSFIFAGAITLMVMIGVLGNWSFDSAIAVMKIKPGFFIFMALACVFISSGFSGVLFESDRQKNKVWVYFYLIFIFAIALLYAFMHTRVNGAAEVFVMTHHIAIASTLALALIFKITEFFTEKKSVKILGIVFLLITSFQLFTYKESDNSFKHKKVIFEVEGAAESSEALVKGDKKEHKANDKTTNKKRHSN